MDTNLLIQILKFSGIGGLSLIIFLSIFKTLIKKDIFPMLDKKQGYSIIKLIMIFTTVVVLFSLSLYGYIEYMGNQPKKPKELSAQITVSTDNRICDEMDKEWFECGEKQKKLDYWVKETADKVEIYPNLEKVLHPVEMFNGENIGLRYPKLDIKVLNNTDETFFIDNIQLNTINSKVDENVYLDIGMICSNEHLTVSNHNRLSYEDENIMNSRVLKSKPKVEFYVSYGGLVSKKRTLEVINKPSVISNGHFEVNIKDALKEIGIDIEKIHEIDESHEHGLYELTTFKWNCKQNSDSCSMESKNEIIKNAKLAISELKDIGINTTVDSLYSDTFDYPVVKGTLTYQIYSYEEKKNKILNIPFSEQVMLFDGFECGDMEPPSATYTTKLKTNDKNYQIQVPVSQSIKSGETDRFQLTLGVDEASFHTFSPVLKSVDGKETKLKDIEIYIP